jgi:nucleoside-diphosphate-sugar epimerase
VKIFVTGGTGFVGSHLVDALLSRSNEVTCLVRNPAKAERIFSHDKQPKIVVGDLNNLEALARGCEHVDAVFHVAGLTAARNRAELFAVNGNATRTLASVANETAPNLQRFVYVSSLAAAGPSTKGTPLREQAATRPVSDYGWSKLAGEEAVRASGLPWTIVRPPTVYGPRDTQILKLFKFAKLGICVFFGDGSQELSLVYVTDLVDALIRSLSPATQQKVFFACHPEIWTTRTFSTEIYQALKGEKTGRPRPRPLTLAVPGTLARGILWTTGTVAALLRRTTLLNADKANELLAEAWTCSSRAIMEATGWQPTTGLAAGLRQTTDWYKNARWL